MASKPAQKNKRLSDSNRGTLLRFAHKQIEATQDRAELDAAYDAAATAVALAVERAFPAKDMKVLARYDLASPDRCIYVSAGGHGEYDRFEFREDDKRIPTRPSRYCRRQPVMLEGAEADAFTQFQTVEKAREEIVRRRSNDFRALIYNTTSFNALADAWPAVEELREAIVGSGSSLSVLSNDVMERIKADPALAMAA